MFPALRLQSDEDIGPFSRLLWQRRISHRIHRLKDGQVLAVARQEQVGEVQMLYERWRRGEVQPGEEDASSMRGWFDGGDTLARLWLAFLRAPLTLGLIFTCLVIALVTGLGSDFALVSLFLYPDFSYGTGFIDLGYVREQFTIGQFLRLFSPMLLHFSLLHIAFNMLWLWELGKRIEARQSSLALLAAVLLTSIVANTGQFLFGGSILFGGMSGVVYGLFAYIWMWQLFDPRQGLGLPGSLIFFMLLSLAILTFLGLDMIADEAHIGGLLAGVVYGAASATISRIRRVFRNEENAR